MFQVYSHNHDGMSKEKTFSTLEAAMSFIAERFANRTDNRDWNGATIKNTNTGKVVMNLTRGYA